MRTRAQPTTAERLRSRIRPVCAYPEDLGSIPEPKAWAGHILCAPEAWRAKLQSHPLRPPGVPCAWVYLSNGEILGHQGVLPMRLRRGESDLPGAWAVDLFVDPKDRVKGIGALLTERIEAHAAIVAAGGLTETAVGLYLKRGWKQPFSLGTYVRPLSVRGFLRSKGIPGWAAWPAAAIDGLLRAHDLAWGALARRGIRIGSIGRFDAEVDRLSERLAPLIGIHAHRSAEFLNWRYLDHPTRSYLALGLYERDRLEGYAIIRTSSFGRLALGIIAEFLCPPNRFAPLAAAALAALRRAGSAIAVARFHGPAFERARRRAGFLRYGKGLPLFVHLDPGLDGGSSAILDEPWFVTWGDSDMEWELRA